MTFPDLKPDPYFENALDCSEDPRIMLRKFFWIGLLCLSVLLVLATYGIYRVFSWRLVETASAEAQAICQVVLVKEKKYLLAFDEQGQARLELQSGEKAGFERRLQQYLKPFDVDAVWVWDLRHRVINRVGDEQSTPVVKQSQALEQALAGGSISRLEKSSEASFRGGIPYDSREQMVSYLPIWGRDNEVLGAFEIRRSIERYRGEMRRGVMFSAVLLGSVLLSLFTCVFLLVKKGVQRLAKAQDILHALATIDALTGIYNRREVLARAEERFSERRGGNRRNIPEDFSILMLDFDDFKNINDSYGHPVGDRVLQELACRIQAVLGPSDIVGRVGGEEFLVVLPDSNSRQCQEVAEQLRQAVRERPFELGDLQVYGSVSIGAATAHSLDPGLEPLLQRADKGLYRAKNLGKDFTCWEDESVSGAGAFE
ncbi:MAG: GGDEF domain-containing protein [Pedobacter sp.]